MNKKNNNNSDTTPPVITLNGDATINHIVGTTYTDLGATATDTVDGDLTDSITTTGSVDVDQIGSYTITYIVSDASGNEATKERIVVVSDAVINPTMEWSQKESTFNLTWANDGDSNNQAINIEVGDTVKWTWGPGTHNLVSTSGVEILDSGYHSSGHVFSHTFNQSGDTNYECQPHSGNMNGTITVQDSISLVITLIGDTLVIHEAGTPYTDQGATATGTVDGDLTDSIIKTGSVDVDQVGSYTITYKVTDSEGNEAIPVTRTVTVRDTTPPVITLIGDTTINHEAGTPYTDQGATATDNIDETINVTTSGTVDINTVGEYTITYTAIDSAGNEATVTRSVIVEEFIEIFGQKYPKSTEKLDLSNNSLIGIIPDELLSLSNLSELNISNNGLTGGIPPFTNLIFLDLSNNNLEGNIPNNLMKKSDSGKNNGEDGYYLNLCNNKLTGTIPSQLFNKLYYLNLSDNQLTGTLDQNYFENEDLTIKIDLSNNNLTGEIPLNIYDVYKEYFDDDVDDELGILIELDLRYNSFTNADEIKILPLGLLKTNPQTPFENTLLKHKDLDQLTWVNKDLFKFKKWLSNSINLDDLYED